VTKYLVQQLILFGHTNFKKESRGTSGNKDQVSRLHHW